MKYEKQIKELVSGLMTKHPTTMSCMLTCPKCEEYGILQCTYFGNTYVWDCLTRKCSFKTNEIPSIKYMEELLELDKKLKDLILFKHIQILK